MTVTRQRAVAAMAIVGAVALVLIVNPIGFIGGSRDDGQYLEAARCWVEGACLPANHWQGRWPVFIPVAALIRLLGESRTVVGLWSLMCATIALILLADAGRRLFGLAVGILAAALLAFTFAFSFQVMRPNADMVEFALVMAAVTCILAWCDGPTGKWAFAAGIFFGLAFQVRETSIVAAAVAFAAMFALGLRPRLRHIAWAAVGFLLPLAAEFVIYHLSTGDPLYRRRLSLSHAQIASSELPYWVDRTKSPLFNAELIANWRRKIHVYWLIDGPLNLVLSVATGLVFLLVPALLLAARRSITEPLRRAAWWLLALAAFYVAAITYVLAMDPKPRVMLIPIALGVLSLSIIISDLFRRRSRALAVALAIVPPAIGISMAALSIRMSWADRQAASWALTYPRQIETDSATREMLMLVGAVRTMATPDSDRPYLMVMRNIGCAEWLSRNRLDWGALSIVGERRLSILPERTKSITTLCLYRYDRPVPQSAIKAALRATPYAGVKPLN